MTTIRKEILIEASPEQVWDVVSDIGAVQYRLVPGYTEITLVDGYERTLLLPNGGMTREYIVSIDDEERRRAYAVVKDICPFCIIMHHFKSSLMAKTVPSSSGLPIFFRQMGLVPSPAPLPSGISEQCRLFYWVFRFFLSLALLRFFLNVSGFLPEISFAFSLLMLRGRMQQLV
ncbi:SRPBCC family protein [Cohnella nanjingensis]|uniref:SRPBCC family protein n=1 Tax=Cohnella nanjingensis TaxID=1387779 RepID=UPI001FE40A99|nr:SRPBCC family protein [Cohnella nanjingensis]